MTDKPFPLIDSDSRGFWDACAQHRLTVGNCPRCAQHFFYPRSRCPRCGGRAHLDQVSGTGRVYAWTRVHRAPPQFRDETPYVVALIELDEGPRVMTRIPTGVVDPSVGDRVHVRFEASADVTLPWFELDDTALS